MTEPHVQVIAEDGGSPRRSGSVTVDIVITDVNDNSPHFTNAVYHVEITENAVPQRNVAVVRLLSLCFTYLLYNRRPGEAIGRATDTCNQIGHGFDSQSRIAAQ